MWVVNSTHSKTSQLQATEGTMSNYGLPRSKKGTCNMQICTILITWKTHTIALYVTLQGHKTGKCKFVHAAFFIGFQDSGLDKILIMYTYNHLSTHVYLDPSIKPSSLCLVNIDTILIWSSGQVSVFAKGQSSKFNFCGRERSCSLYTVQLYLFHG